MTKKKITINDVAETAGVSKATVSRYLNGRTDLMTEKTRDRIAHVIDLLNYHPSELARSLKSKKTRTIGVILTDIRSPFYSAVLSGIDEKLNEFGYSAVYVNSSDDPEKELANLQNLLSKDVDGILINTVSYRNEPLISETANRIPMVLIDREIENHSFSVVKVDNKKMVSLLFDHLEEEGFNRFAFFTGPWRNISTRIARREGFLEEVEKRFRYDATADVFSIGDDYPSYEEGLNTFLSTLKEGDIPCVIGSNSVSTFSAYHAIALKKLRVPEDIGIAGPEDWAWADDMSWPDVMGTPVTTMVFDSKEIGRRSAELMIEKIDDPNCHNREVIVPANLFVRESTKRKGDQ